MLSVIHITAGYTWSTETLAVASLRLNCRQSISRFGKLSLWENSVGNMVGFVWANLDCVHKVLSDWQKPSPYCEENTKQMLHLVSVNRILSSYFYVARSHFLAHLTVFASHDQFLRLHFSSFAPLVGPLYFPHCDWLAEEKRLTSLLMLLVVDRIFFF